MSEIYLCTERLELRRLEEGDFADYCAYAMDESMARMMGNSVFRTKEDVRLNFDWLKDKEPRSYGLVYRKSGHIIGNLNVAAVLPELMQLDELRGKTGCTLSFCISKSWQRQGLMFEAVSAVIRKLFHEEGLDYIQCGHFTFNEASASLQAKLGFKPLTSLSFSHSGEELVTVENILWNNK